MVISYFEVGLICCWLRSWEGLEIILPLGLMVRVRESINVSLRCLSDLVTRGRINSACVRKLSNRQLIVVIASVLFCQVVLFF